MKKFKIQQLVVSVNEEEAIEEDSLVDTREIDINNRLDGNLKDKSFYLSPLYNWSLGLDSEDCLVLVPLKK